MKPLSWTVAEAGDRNNLDPGPTTNVGNPPQRTLICHRFQDMARLSAAAGLCHTRTARTRDLRHFMVETLNDDV
jgi:hypothetical protein